MTLVFKHPYIYIY